MDITSTLTLDERRELCRAANVTLDGKQAKICGARGLFATVAVVPDGPSHDFAWSVVARIVADGGEFRSIAQQCDANPKGCRS
jgi:hypothetical protein